MPKPVVLLICLLIAVVGCSTASRQARQSRIPDWSGIETNPLPPAEFEHVPEGPQLAAPAATLPEPFRPNLLVSADALIPVDRWSRENKFGTLRETAVVPVPAFALNSAQGVLTFQAKSLRARWNGLEIHLGFEPQMIGGQPFFHTLDLDKNLKPLLRAFAVPARTNRLIVLDPGHGGKNAGTESVLGGVNEKEYTLDWARRIARLLTTNGWQVLLTRTDDAEISLSNRVAFAEEHHADLFVSLHFNSVSTSHEQMGLETYCLTPVGMPSTLKRGYEDDAALVFANNAFDEQNFQLALKVHRALIQGTGLADRGVRRARFLGVLRGQNRPAILIEGGYLSNPREARRIADPAFRQKLAESVANALIH